MAFGDKGRAGTPGRRPEHGGVEGGAAPRKKGTGGGYGLMALFALPFAGVGLAVLLLGVLPTLYDWQRMRSWQPVPATVLQAQLRTHKGSDSGPTHSVAVRYRYEVAGRVYEGERAAVNTLSDNIGDFHERLARRLQAAQRSGRPLQVWVNPAAPHEAVADRSLRGGLLGFMLLFALLFGGVGGGLLVAALSLRRSDARRARRQQLRGDAAPAQPWLLRSEWAGNRIRSDKRWEVWVAWGFATVWCLLSLPIVVVGAPQAWRGGDHGVVGAAALFALAGAGLLVWAVRATLDARRHGEVVLELDPFPGAIGGHVGATLLLPRTPYRADARFAVTLCWGSPRFQCNK